MFYSTPQIPSSSNYLLRYLPSCRELPSGNVKNLFRRDSTRDAPINSSVEPFSLTISLITVSNKSITTNNAGIIAFSIVEEINHWLVLNFFSGYFFCHWPVIKNMDELHSHLTLYAIFRFFFM